MNLLLDRLGSVLSAPPDSVIAAARVRSRRPSVRSELPVVVVLLTVEQTRGTGLNRHFRAGEGLVRYEQVVTLDPNNELISDDLRTLRLWPAPIKRNPSSAGPAFGSADISIINVTDASSPVNVAWADDPAERNEFRYDERRGVIIFGQPRSAGETLQVTHWTVDWQEAVRGYRYAGRLSLELWGTSDNQVDQLSRRLQGRLRDEVSLVRRAGFARLESAELGAAEEVLHKPPNASPFGVWKQPLAYRFAFEAEETSEASAGARIRRIDVDADGELNEQFTVP